MKLLLLQIWEMIPEELANTTRVLFHDYGNIEIQAGYTFSLALIVAILGQSSRQLCRFQRALGYSELGLSLFTSYAKLSKELNVIEDDKAEEAKLQIVFCHGEIAENQIAIGQNRDWSHYIKHYELKSLNPLADPRDVAKCVLKIAICHVKCKNRDAAWAIGNDALVRFNSLDLSDDDPDVNYRYAANRLLSIADAMCGHITDADNGRRSVQVHMKRGHLNCELIELDLLDAQYWISIEDYDRAGAILYEVNSCPNLNFEDKVNIILKQVLLYLHQRKFEEPISYLNDSWTSVLQFLQVNIITRSFAKSCLRIANTFILLGEYDDATKVLEELVLEISDKLPREIDLIGEVNELIAKAMLENFTTHQLNQVMLHLDTAWEHFVESFGLNNYKLGLIQQSRGRVHLKEHMYQAALVSFERAKDYIDADNPEHRRHSISLANDFVDVYIALERHAEAIVSLNFVIKGLEEEGRNVKDYLGEEESWGIITKVLDNDIAALQMAQDRFASLNMME